MKEVEKVLNQYYEHFGKNYPLGANGNLADEEIIADIQRCIAEKHDAEQPSYEENADY